MCDSEVQGKGQSWKCKLKSHQHMDGIQKHEPGLCHQRVTIAEEEVGRLDPGAVQCLKVHPAPASQV